MNKVDRLQKLILEAEDLIKNSENNSDPKFSAWNSSVIRFIENEFGQKSNDAKNFSNRLYEPAVLAIGPDNSKLIHDVYIRDLQKSLAELKSIYEEILEDDSEINNKKIATYKNTDNTNVFIVHGRDNYKKDEISDFVKSLGLNPIILHEQPNNGETLIEKLERNADNVSSAIILFTPDDEGKLKETNDELKTRARQNVVFEAGYFMGKLGRNRVIILNGVEETMSDISGIVYIPIDNYKSAIRKEFIDMGYKING